MTTELEKEFFDTFGIEPIAEYCKHQCNNELDESACIGCKYIEKVEYPQITDKQYLELICILNDYTGIDVRAIKIEELKEELLKHCIELIEYELYIDDDINNFKHQVQEIFGSNQ